nr:MAG TPA: hypothetical protein [Caudoviricetes sp.]
MSHSKLLKTIIGMLIRDICLLGDSQVVEDVSLQN